MKITLEEELNISLEEQVNLYNKMLIASIGYTPAIELKIRTFKEYAKVRDAIHSEETN